MREPPSPYARPVRYSAENPDPLDPFARVWPDPPALDDAALIDEGAAALTLAGVPLWALRTGALWIPVARALVVADLHFGKSERHARRGGTLLPPYEIDETLDRLSDAVDAMRPEQVVCLGDSFDDVGAVLALTEAHRRELARLGRERTWVWVAGNHDPELRNSDTGIAGVHTREWRIGPLLLRHEATPRAEDVFRDARYGVWAEISGHFHPKATLIAQGRRLSRRCFLVDDRRAILPAFGAFTGGLDAAERAFDPAMGPEATALLVGRPVRALPRSALAAPHALPHSAVQRAQASDGPDWSREDAEIPQKGPRRRPRRRRFR